MTAIVGDGIVLRDWRESDVDILTKAANDPLIERFQQNFPSPYTRDDALWWIYEGSQVGHAFAVADLATDEIVGGCGTGAFREAPKTVEVGYWVVSWARGRGIATEALQLMSNWLFEQGYARLELLLAHDNCASQRVALKAGFSYEGVRRDAGIRRDGSLEDLNVFFRLDEGACP